MKKITNFAQGALQVQNAFLTGSGVELVPSEAEKGTGMASV